MSIKYRLYNKGDIKFTAFAYRLFCGKSGAASFTQIKNQAELTDIILDLAPLR